MNSISTPHRPRVAFTLIELLVALAIIGVLFSLLMPSLGKALERARKNYCLNNLRQFGLAIHGYALDFQNRLPLAEPTPTNPIDPATPYPRIRDVLSHYVGDSAGIFKCPNDTARFASEGSSYEWTAPNPSGLGIGFGGQDKDKLKNFFLFNVVPEKAVIMFDYDNNHVDRNGNGAKNVVFADGHIETL